MEKLTASIVAYKTDPQLLQKTISSFLNSTLTGRLMVIDNSPTDELGHLCYDLGVQYLFYGKNLGYGKAHNIAMAYNLNRSLYHLVLNPDVSFGANTLEKIFYFMEDRPQAGLSMPKVFGINGELQALCKLLPTPINLVTRGFLPFENWSRELNEHYEMKNSGYDQVMNVPFLSGCFMFLRNSALKEVGLFDERFFLYSEDTDLSRRMHRQFQTLFFPGAEIQHVHANGSHKDFKLTLCKLKSAIQYFYKWGWFFDDDRQVINRRALCWLPVICKEPIAVLNLKP